MPSVRSFGVLIQLRLPTRRSITILVCVLGLGTALPLLAEVGRWEKHLRNLAAMETQVRNERLLLADTVADPVAKLDAHLAASEGLSGDPHEFAKAQAFARTWYTGQKHYQGLIDARIIAKEAYLLERVREEMFLVLTKQAVDRQAELLSSFATLEDVYAEWFDYQDRIGLVDPREQRIRLYRFRDYFVASQRFLTTHKLGREVAGGPSAKKAGKSVDLFAYLHFLLASVDDLLTSWEAISQTKVFTIGTKLARNYLHLQAYPIEVSGRENLEQADAGGRQGKLVRLLLPSHRSDMGDVFLMASLGLDNAILFANAEVIGQRVCPIAPHLAGNLIADARDMVGVGECRGREGLRPTAKMLKALRDGVSRNIVNYPQGFVASIDEYLPLNQNFAEKLIRPLLEAGYELEVYPISFDSASPFLAGLDRMFEQPMRVSIPRAIPPRVVAFLMGLEPELPQIFNMLVRSFWLEHARLYPELSLADLHSRIEDALHLQLKGFENLPKHRAHLDKG